MTFQNIVDSVLKETKYKLNNEEKADAFVLLFSSLKRNGFKLKDVGFDETLYITNKLDGEFSKQYLSSLQEQLVFLDIKKIAESILTNEEQVVPAESETIQQNPAVRLVYKNDEHDVLDDEGYMEAPKKGPMYIDKEYAKLLGIIDE